MKKQPAKLNYFFKGGYVELFNTIKSSYKKLGANISDAWFGVTDNFSDFWDTFWPAIGGIFSFDVDWDDLLIAITSVCKFSFSLGKLIFVLIITTGLSTVFSLLHISILFPIMLFAYSAYAVLLCIDTFYCWGKKISSNCSNPNCQSHFSLPVYLCPSCGARHTSLRPSRYGIWKRTCECGEKLPTTFFNGREKLEARCPVCEFPVKDGGKHMDICIPIVGGTSSGKTCFINSSISEIEKKAAEYGLIYEYSPSGSDDYQINVENMSQGRLPEKTNEMRLKYYQFYLSESENSLKNLISLCDVGGEVYSDSLSLGQQIGYRYANAFILVVDPLSIAKYREEVAKVAEPGSYGYSNDSIDEIITMLTTTLENMYCISSKEMLKTEVAVVFTKCDIPGLMDKIGSKAVDEWMSNHAGANKNEAQNAVCEKFLIDYDEVNFLNSLKSKFKTLQFFCCSALGHNADGTPFVSVSVDEPVLWLLDRIPGTIDLKGKIDK